MTTYKQFIEFDWRDGSLRFVEVPDYENGIPFDVHHGLCEWFKLSYREYDADEIVEAFKEEFGERLEEQRKKFDEEWDGHNWVASWRGDEEDGGERRNEDEEQLHHEVQEWSEHMGSEVWDANDYYLGGLTFKQVVDELEIMAETTDKELIKIANDAIDEALSQGIKLSKMHEFAEYVRTRLIEEKDEEND